MVMAKLGICSNEYWHPLAVTYLKREHTGHVDHLYNEWNCGLQFPQAGDHVFAQGVAI